MKNSVFIILMLFLSYTLIALESDPSATVGYVRVDADIGYTYFSLPFTFYDSSPTPVETLDLDDIIGTQLTGGNLATGDRIIEIGTGIYAYLNSGTNLWTGVLSDFTDNMAYYFKVHTFHDTADVYLAGKVVQETQTVGTCGIGYTFVSIREAGEIAVSALDLIISGFLGGNLASSDRLIEADTGYYAYYNTGTSSWAGSLTNIYPGKVYLIKVHTAHSGFTWLYDPLTRESNIFNENNSRSQK